jgi:hypothetical protein
MTDGEREALLWVAERWIAVLLSSGDRGGNGRAVVARVLTGPRPPIITSEGQARRA